MTQPRNRGDVLGIYGAVSCIRAFAGIRRPVQPHPGHDPGKPDRAGSDERPAPTPVQCDVRDHQRPDHGAHIGSGIENARGERAFTLREPFGHRLNRGREVARLAETERKSRHAEPERRSRQRVPHRRQAPPCDADGVPEPGSNTIDDPAEPHQRESIGRLERGNDQPII
jgi:hypothetical protein